MLSKQTALLLVAVFILCIGYLLFRMQTSKLPQNGIAKTIARTNVAAFPDAIEYHSEAFVNITNNPEVVSVDNDLIGTKFRSENLEVNSPVPFSRYSNICLDSKVNKFVAYGVQDEARPFHRYGIYDEEELRAYGAESQMEEGTWGYGDRWLPGSTVLLAEGHNFGNSVKNFFHSMEHLSGTWLTGGQDSRDDVRHVVYLVPGLYIPGFSHQYDFFGEHDMAAHTIRALYPKARILVWESMLAAAQAAPSGRLCMPLSVISDREVSWKDEACLKLNKMLANLFPTANQNHALAMTQALWKYSRVTPIPLPRSAAEAATRQVRLLYTTRHSKRVFSDELDTKIIALLSSIPGVELTVADFSSFSFAEQVSRIAQTDILFGLHGSGLTHLLWLPPHATVIEIFPEKSLAIDYRVFARLRGLDYVGLQAQRGPASPISDKEAFSTGPYGAMVNRVVKELDLYAVMNVIDKVKYRIFSACCPL